MAVKLNKNYLADFIGADELKGIQHEVEASVKMLHEKTGLGNDFLGWLNLPTDYDKEEFARRPEDQGRPQATRPRCRRAP